MDTQRINMMWRIPLVAGVVTALVLFGFWLVNGGYLPEITTIKWSNHTTITLPFAISRMWDVLFAAIWALIITFLFSSPGIKNNQALSEGLIFAIILGLFIGMIAGLLFGLSFVVRCGLIVGLFVGLGVKVVFGLSFGLFFGLSFGLFVGLGAGLTVGLVAGLGFGLGAGLGAGLGVILKLVGRGIAWLFSKRFFQWLGGH